MPASIWVDLLSLACAAAVTLATRVLVKRRRDRPYASRRIGLSVFGNLLWIGLMFAAGLLVYRYAERLHHEWWFYVACGVALTSASLEHALLLAHIEERRVDNYPRPGHRESV